MPVTDDVTDTLNVQVAPAANLLAVIKGVRDVFPDIHAQLPRGLEAHIMYDSTDFVNASIHEVVVTLVEALIIVMLVIFAFLGSPRSVLSGADRIRTSDDVPQTSEMRLRAGAGDVAP